MGKPNTELRQRPDFPSKITPMYGSRPRPRYGKSPGRGAHTVDYSMSMKGTWYHVPGTRYLYPSTCSVPEWANLSTDCETSSSQQEPRMYTMHILPVLVHTERLSWLNPATMGALPYVPTFLST